MLRRLIFRLLFAAFFLLSGFHAPLLAHGGSTLTISGRVTHEGVPVAGALVRLYFHGSGRNVVLHTDAGGRYRFSAVPVHVRVTIHIRPAIDSRLAYRNWEIEVGAADLEKHFELQAGHLLSGQVLAPDGSGSPFALGAWLDVISLIGAEPEGEWLGDGIAAEDGTFEVVLPPGVYCPCPLGDWPSAEGYFPAVELDLQEADLTGVILQMRPAPYPERPADISKILVGPPDALGEALVEGAPGAVPPSVLVLLVNLNSSHQAHTVSAADGSFNTRLFAPPGSSLLIRHGPASRRWRGVGRGVSHSLNPYPATIMHVPFSPESEPPMTPFSLAGGVGAVVDDSELTTNYVSAAWTLEGGIGPLAVEGEWRRALAGVYESRSDAGFYLGGLNWTHPSLADLDGDGDLDLLVGERSGRLVLFRNQGSPGSPDWRFESDHYAGVDCGEWAYPALADLTADSAPDLLVGTGYGEVWIYYNQGTAGAPKWPEKPSLVLAAGSRAAPALGDLDNDGDLDLLVGYQTGRLTHFQNTGTRKAPSWKLVTTAYADIREADSEGIQPLLTDLDRDGDLDLLLGRQGDLAWYRNDGPPANPRWTRMGEGFMGFRGSSAVSPAAGDWDGDGNQDLVTGEHWGVLRFHRNDRSAGWSEKERFLTLDLDGDSAPAFADWDGDGDLDMVVGQAHGRVYGFRNAGTAKIPDWHPQGILLTLPWTDHPHAFPALADIDGDGDPDLFVGEGGWPKEKEAGGNIHYYRNDGTRADPRWNLVTRSFLGLDVGGWATPAFVDIDADGDLDLFVGDAEGTLTLVENRGTRTAPAWAPPVHKYAGLKLGDFSAPAFLDVDGDGDLDLFSGKGSGGLAYVRNEGTVRKPVWNLITLEYPPVQAGDRTTPAAADLDGDGRPDLVLGDGDGGLNFYRYAGVGRPADISAIKAGDILQIRATLRIYGRGLSRLADPSSIRVGGWAHLRMLFNAEGKPLAANNSFMSTLLTPSGFPIQGAGQPVWGADQRSEIAELRRIGEYGLEGNLTLDFRLPEDLPRGVYRPILYFGFDGLPEDKTWVAAYVTNQYTYPSTMAALPPLRLGNPEAPHLVWRLMMEDYSQGLRGTGAREDRRIYQPASQIVTQGAPYSVPPIDERTGEPVTYRLEPFLPMISFTDRRVSAPPLLPFLLPGGELKVWIQQPDGSVVDLGSAQFTQPLISTRTTRGGWDLNPGTVQLNDVYSLTTGQDRFRFQFTRYGHHVISMTGKLTDVWGNVYHGGGTYDLWVAHLLDIEPGVLPGTPFQVGNHFNPAVQLYPPVPAYVNLEVSLYPDSDPARVARRTLSGRASSYGQFAIAGEPLVFHHPGEYRVDLTTFYEDREGKIFMGAMAWGGVVETPGSQLVAHGRRGVDSLREVPDQSWFSLCRDLEIPAGVVSHTLNPYFNGDIAWTRMSDVACGGDALVMGCGVQDTVGNIERLLADRAGIKEFSPPGTIEERIEKGEAPLFVATRFQRSPHMVPEEIVQLAYSYRTSQRPGVRVREVVAEDSETGGYWRLDTLYDDQMGVGVLGDQVNDFKFQYIGAVFRDLTLGINQYAIQGSLWVFIPDDDPLGSRVMPPFSGPGNGGWTTDGGPILTLKGKPIDMFVFPTGVGPGQVLEVGDTFRFAGHVAPTLDSLVGVNITSPSGKVHRTGGQANRIGYYYMPRDDLVVDEPGRWTVDVLTRHDGACSGGFTVPPYPSGDVLGSENGRYWFYVVPEAARRLEITNPGSGWLNFSEDLMPIDISGKVPGEIRDAVVDYTISMPGFILKQGRLESVGTGFSFTFDPVRLQAEFPNIDLVGREDPWPGLSDTFYIGVLLTGTDADGLPVHRANTLTLQGNQVFVGDAPGVPEDCLGLGADLGIRIPCFEINGTKFGFGLAYDRGLEWSLDILSLTPSKGNQCLGLDERFGISVPCLDVADTQVGFTLKYSHDLNWEIDPATILLH